MSAKSLQREVERRRRRASKLGVDDLICDLVFDHGFRNYMSWSKDPNYSYTCVSQATAPEDGHLAFTLCGRSYSIRTTKEPYVSDDETVKLELWQGDSLVFGQLIDVEWHGYSETYMPTLTTAFVEGNWIEAFRTLEREVLVVEERNRGRREQERAASEASRFGIAPPKPGSLSLLLREMGDFFREALMALMAIPLLLISGVGALLQLVIFLLVVVGVIGILVFGLRQLF